MTEDRYSESPRGANSPAALVPADTPGAVRAFWFSLPRPGKRDDEAVRAVLGPLYERAAALELDGWLEAPWDRLALILLLDQVPRHLYRRDARAYVTDLKAQAAAGRFFREGAFRRADGTDFDPPGRYYAALPYLHAEDVEKQEAVNPVMHHCAARIPRLGYMGPMADLYRETIARFGRFPHRNRMRGLEDTPQEGRFLAEEWYPRRRRIHYDCPLERLVSPLK